MQVETRFGTKSMSELQTGDEVLAPVEGGQFVWQPITWFLHRDHSVRAEFVELKTATQTISLTAHHLIPVAPCDLDLATLDAEGFASIMAKYAIYAERAQLGQCLVRVENAQVSLEAIQLKQVVEKQGIYSPMTSSGSLVVQGIHASCYSSSMESYLMQHTFYSYYYKLARLLASLNPFATEQVDQSSRVAVPFGVMLVGQSQPQRV